jgi:chromosome partitioning protein
MTLVITLASSKGGAGKTTITELLAVRALKDGKRVTLVDLDPQQSLSMWLSRRRGEPPFKLINDVPAGRVADTIRDLRRSGVGLVLIDTPPALTETIEDAIAVADFVLIPAKPTSHDVVAISPVVDWCKRHDRPFAFVLSEADQEWRITTSARKTLSTLGDVVATAISRRVSYASAPTNGRTAPETDDKKQAAAAKEEVDALWVDVMKLVATAGLEAVS